jgi:thioredoxin 1
MIIDLNEANFTEVTSRAGIVLVDCWAAWCRNCDDFGDAYSRAAEKHPDLTFATLDTQKQRELRLSLDIRHVPALMVFRDGILLFKQAGSFDEGALEDVIDQAGALDMDLVRAELAKVETSNAA